MKKSALLPRERLISSLDHREADRIPFDLGGNPNAGIHEIAYRNLLTLLGEKRKITVDDTITQQARIHEDILQKLKVDTRKVTYPLGGTVTNRIAEEQGYSYFIDDYGIKWGKPDEGGLYYDIRSSPLTGSISKEDIKALPMPALPGPEEIKNLRKEAGRYAGAGYAVIVPEPAGGLFEQSCWLRGFEDFLADLALNLSIVESLLDRLVEFRLRYWTLLLKELGDYIDIVAEADDVATQDSLMCSPQLFRKIFKPRYKIIFDHIKKEAKKPVYIVVHSCGAIRELIPDFIEVGVDALNPVQVSAAGMDTRSLKKDFGADITFWGGGVDTQKVLPHGTPQQVREEVKRRIDDLAPGGGFVFATVHNIQADVPPENIVAMWETLQEYGTY